MPADIQDYTQAVNVLGGSVAISGVASVSISGTPTVQFAAGQSVSISGVPTVSISGTASVSISSGTVNVQTAGSTVVNAAGVRTALTPFTVNPSATVTQRETLPANVNELELKLSLAGLTTPTVTVTGVTSGWVYFPQTHLASVPARLVITVDVAQDAQVDVRVQNDDALGNVTTVLVTAVQDVDEVVVLSNPGQEPNIGAIVSLGSLGTQESPYPVDAKQATFAVSVPAGGSSTIVAGSGTLVTRVYQAHIEIDAGAGTASLRLEDTAAQVIWAKLASNNTTPRELVLGGVGRAGGGLGVRLFNEAGVALGIRGYIVYTQRVS